MNTYDNENDIDWSSIRSSIRTSNNCYKKYKSDNEFYKLKENDTSDVNTRDRDRDNDYVIEHNDSQTKV